MFCPTCIRSYPEEAEKCPKCEGPLTNVIQIYADDEPSDEGQIVPAASEKPAESPSLTTTAEIAAQEGPPVPVLQSPDEQTQYVKADFGSPTQQLWIVTALCTVLLFTVLYFDSPRSNSDPQPSPISQSDESQVREEAPAPKEVEEKPEGPTREELRIKADAILLQAKRSRQAGDLEFAEEQAKEAFRLHSELDDNEESIAYSLEELAQVHVEMDRLVEARAELNQAQRLAYNSDRKELLSKLSSAPSTKQTTLTSAKKRPSLGEASKVPQAAPRVTTSTSTNRQPVARRRMKEIEIYRPANNEGDEQTHIPLGQQDVVESYRGTRRGKNKIRGL